MLVQVLGGLYGFLFYMSEIFNSAGKSWRLLTELHTKINKAQNLCYMYMSIYIYIFFGVTGISSTVGYIVLAVILVGLEYIYIYIKNIV